MVGNLTSIAGGGEQVLVGPETSDDAGVYLLDERAEGSGARTALVATADFITPVCDDPRRFGRVAAANAISDVYAMGGEVLFALNLCCFPEKGVPDGVLAEILEGAAETLAEAGGALIGGHSVRDSELKFGLSVVGRADPERLLTNAGARAGDRLVLTKRLGTGVLINAFKLDKTDEATLEPVLAEMERLNRDAARLALEHGAHGATDVTGFGLVGHAQEIAKASGVAIEIDVASLPVHDAFFALVERGVTTGATAANEKNTEGSFVDRANLSPTRREILFDPQTSGGLLISLPAENAESLLDALRATDHHAAIVGTVVAGTPSVSAV